MKKRETLFKERVMLALQALPNSWCEKIQQRTIRGTPDIILCCRGLFVALELKTDEGIADALQVHKLNRIKRASGLAMVVDPESWPGVYRLLIDIATGKRNVLAHPEDALRGGLKDH